MRWSSLLKHKYFAETSCSLLVCCCCFCSGDAVQCIATLSRAPRFQACLSICSEWTWLWILAEIEWKKKRLEEEDEFEDLTDEAKTLQEQELDKVGARRAKKKKTSLRLPNPRRGGVTTHGVHAQIQSNLGRLILKEEKEEKEKAVRFRRKTQSLPDRTHMHTSEPEDSFSRNRFCFCCFFCIFMGSDAFPSPQVCLPVLPNLLRTPAQAWPEWVLQRQLPAHLLVSVAEFVRLRPNVLHNFKIH